MKICQFCHSNGETKAQYQSHMLRNFNGLVTCPVLRAFTCPICKVTGDYAHTVSYCPQNKTGMLHYKLSMTELKKKKNTAGNMPRTKPVSPCHTSISWYKPCPITSPLPSSYQFHCLPTTDQLIHYHSEQSLFSQKMQLYHQAEIVRLMPIMSVLANPIYIRNFPIPPLGCNA